MVDQYGLPVNCKKGRWICACLFGALLCFGTAELSAQGSSSSRSRNPFGNSGLQHSEMQYGAPSGTVDNDAEEQRADTTKKAPRVRKPLESYFFNDSLRARHNFAWTPSMSFNEVKPAVIDTAMNNFQNDYPFLQQGVGAIYTGNQGGAAMPLDYYARPRYRDFSFAQVLDAYLITPERVRFYNVKNPFSQVNYFMSGQVKRFEEGFKVTHAQNVSPSTGFNIEYYSRGARGMYTNHKTRDKNLSMAFSHTGKKYTVQAGYIYNMANLKDNGGITEDRWVRDTVFEQPELIPVNLQDAKSLLKNNTFYLFQSYGIPLRRLSEEDFSIADRSSFFVGHSMQYSNFSRVYTDTRSGSEEYYGNWYIDPSATRDSTYERLFSNKVFLQIQPWDRDGVVGTINAGLGYDMHLYSQFHLEDYLTKESSVKKNSTYVYGSLRGKVSRYVDWNGFLRYHPFNYRSGDMNVGGELTLRMFARERPITLSGRVEFDKRSPDWWTEHYFSNHFAWENAFSQEDETRFEVRFSLPSVALELGATQSVTQNKIYYGPDCVPLQYGGSVSVTGLYAQKDFRLGGLHLNNRVLIQLTNREEVAQVPLTSVYCSYYYEFNVVRNVLRVQFGLDGRYNSRYDGFGYNPALMQFHTYALREGDRQLGDYLMLDVFLAAKWKRMRILAKMQHVNEDLFGERNYFAVQHQPLNKRMFKLGFSWSFYD